MKYTQQEYATFESTQKHVVFQMNQLSGKMAPILSIRSFTREFKLKAIHYWYYDGENVNQAFNKFKTDYKQIRNWVKSEEPRQKQKRTLRSTRPYICFL